MSTFILVGARSFEAIPQRFGTATILFGAIAIASTMSLTRHRQSLLLVRAWQMGNLATATISANAVVDTCVVALDDGVIRAARRGDAIGWSDDSLAGRDLASLFEARSHGPRTIEPGNVIAVPMRNERGEVFDAKVCILSLGEDGDGQVVACIAPTVLPRGVAN
ncbi:hypothetical protein [Streptomyces sp. NPDC055085]